MIAKSRFSFDRWSYGADGIRGHASSWCWARALALALVLQGGACDENSTAVRAGGNGDAHEGWMTIQRAGCGSCHAIPGVPDADGTAGPPLSHFGRRTTVAGLLPNTSDNLVRWVRYPQSVSAGSIMPDMGLSEDQARDVAAYLNALD